MICQNVKAQEPISNNKLKKVNIKRFVRDNKEYMILEWKSVLWPVSNKSVKIIENTIKSFKKLDIPFKYIISNEKDLNDIKVYEFTDKDNNVDVFIIKIILNIKSLEPTINGRKEKT